MREPVSVDGTAIGIFGATGYTGRLIAHELGRHRAPLVLAGRDPAKLERLAAEVGGAAVVPATVDDAASLDRLARRVRVLINCVGPFVDLGEPVVRAAVAAGAHYLDTTGEQPFVKAMLVHDTWAKSQGVAVVPALAFEVALSDCAAALAAEGLDDVDAVRVAYVTRFHPSQGTKRTAVRMLQREAFAYADGAWVREAPGAHMAFLDLPNPIGSIAAVSFPSADVITIPRHVAAREVRAFLSMPVVAARVLSATAPLVASVARSPLGGLYARLLGTGTEGPNAATRQRDVFHVAVEARGRKRGQPAAARIIVRGRDPYGVTAAIARQGASLLLHGRPRAAGVLAPAMAFEPRRFLDGLAAAGVQYE